MSEMCADPALHALADKLTTPDQALQHLRPGDRIYLGAGSAVPTGLVEALVDPKRALQDVEITHLLTLGAAPYAEPEFAGRVRHNALFIGPNVRSAVVSGRADYTPVFLSEIPELIRTQRIPIDVALLSVTPPDEDGYCSFGTHVDLAPSAAAAARDVIVQVNPHLPRTCGHRGIHVDRIRAATLLPAPLPALPIPPKRDETEAIARHIADLVPDESTLQLGIGGIPDAVLTYLTDRRDLGIHTEMFSDGVIALIEKGVINGRCKTLHTGKVIASFVLGSEATYNYLHNNSKIELFPSDYVNDPAVIAQHDNMIAINTCLQVDLTGQVCSDSLGSHFYSGIGGQVDFIRGAARSRGGKPIIAVPSTACDGTISRIVPRLEDGAGVVTTRGDVHWVVTEYGAVNLHGKSVRERALALVTIAHPKFRPWLLAEAKRLHFVYADQIEPPITGSVYPRQLETTIKLRDGRDVFLRPIRPTDESRLREMFYGLQRDSVYQRFFSVKTTLPHAQLQHFCTIDYQRDMTLLACAGRGEQDDVLGWAGYSLDGETGFADAAFLVADAHQGQGLGTQLLRRLTEIAEARGVSGFTAHVLASNARMQAVFGKCGYPLEAEREGEVLRLRIPFADGRASWHG